MYDRGINSQQEQEQWLSAGWESIYDWTALPILEDACVLLYKHIENNNVVQIVIDSDADGLTASAILYNYLWKRFPEWCEDHLFYILHKGKEHGLADVMSEIFEDCKLVICPDAGSNDCYQHQILADIDIDCLILDHHLIEDPYMVASSPAFIVNIQLEDYPNKSLTGAGVTYKFISAFEDMYIHGNQPTEFMDLCALGNCGDMADSRQPEIRGIINVGFSNIKNPFLFELCKKHEYTLQKRGGINYLSMAFAAVPFLNAICRTGTMEDKHMVFQAMLTRFAFDKVPSSKRGDNGVEVYRYQEAVTVADRIKRNQDKLVQEAMSIFDERIEEEHLTDNAIILLTCEPDEVEASVAGLIANKVQAKYQHPCLVLRRTRLPGDKEDVYRGSGRNYSHCPIENMKDMCEKTGLTVFQAGHNSAFGCGIAASKIEAFTKAANELYKDVDFTPTYWVDYIWQADKVNTDAVLEIADLTIWGQEMPESMIAVEDIPIDENNVVLLSPDKHPTIKITYGGIEYIKFGSSQEELESMLEGNMLTVVGTCGKNIWMDKITPQIKIEDYEVSEEWIF